MSYYIALILSLAVAAAGCAVRRRSSACGQAMIVCGCLGLVGCIAWQVSQNVLSPGPAGPDRGQAVVAYFLANQVLNEVGDREGTVLLFFPPEDVLEEEAVGTYAGTFARTLLGFPGLKVETLKLEVPSKAAKAGQIPLAAFRQAASNAPAAVAYVSFAGVPAEIEDFAPVEPHRTPGFYVFDPWGTTNWLAALRKRQVRCAIVPRPGVTYSPGDEVSGAPNDVFDQLYLLATPENVDRVAAELRAR